MSDGIRDAEGRRPDWMTCSTGYCSCAAKDAELARLRAELKAETEARLLAIEEADSLHLVVSGLQKELAAERERCARYNEMAGKDADALAAERAKYEAASTALDLTIAERDKYADDAVREREKRELAEQASRYNLDVCEQMEERAKLAEEQRDALAAALENIRLFHEAPRLNRDHEWGNELAAAINAAIYEVGWPSAILASVKADQRRKGAAWALREVAIHCAVSEMGPDVSYGLSNALTMKADAIESSEVEVPND